MLEIKNFYPVIFGGLIGYLTNWVAIKMLFWPKTSVLFLQGAVPKNKIKIAENIAKTSTEHLFSAGEIACLIKNKISPETIKKIGANLLPQIINEIDSSETKDHIGKMVLANVDKDSASYVFIKGIIKGVADNISIKKAVSGSEKQIITVISDNLYPVIIENSSEIIENAICSDDIQKIIREKVMAMDEYKIEKLIRDVSQRELTLIEWSGAVLGIAIGFIQMLF